MKTDKENLKDIIKLTPHDTLLTSILELSNDVVTWQQRYNKAATKIEELTNKKQMKILVEEPIKIALNRIDRSYNE